MVVVLSNDNFARKYFKSESDSDDAKIAVSADVAAGPALQEMSVHSLVVMI